MNIFSSIFQIVSLILFITSTIISLSLSEKNSLFNGGEKIHKIRYVIIVDRLLDHIIISIGVDEKSVVLQYFRSVWLWFSYSRLCIFSYLLGKFQKSLKKLYANIDVIHDNCTYHDYSHIERPFNPFRRTKSFEREYHYANKKDQII